MYKVRNLIKYWIGRRSPTQSEHDKIFSHSSTTSTKLDSFSSAIHHFHILSWFQRIQMLAHLMWISFISLLWLR